MIVSAVVAAFVVIVATVAEDTPNSLTVTFPEPTVTAAVLAALRL